MAQPKPAEKIDTDSIGLYTKEGEKIVVSKDQWKEALPEYFEKATDDPDKTYKLIVVCLQDGLFAECVAPARRLCAIDSNKERAVNLLGVVLLKNKLLDEAEEVLQKYLTEQGQSGVILANLAKVYVEKGDEKEGYKTLWKALRIDPNQENALAWWYAIHAENKKTARLYDSLKKLSEIPGSWRPLIYLAINSLDDNKSGNALALFKKALAIAPGQGDALTIVSGELASRGHVRDALNLVYPLYDARKHGHAAGLNLILACISLKEREKGLQLCDAVEQLGRTDQKEKIKGLREKLQGL